MAKAKTRRRPAAPLGASLVVMSSFFYASYGIWTKLLGNFLGGYTASAIRSVLVLIMLAPIAAVYRKWQPVDWSRNRRYLIGMIVSSLFTWGPLFYAVIHAGVAVALTVSYAGIIIGSFVFGWLFGGEGYTRDKFIATVLSFVGLWLVFTPSLSSGSWLAVVAALVSGLSAGSNGACVKQLSYNATQSTLALWSASLVANTVMAVVVSEAPVSGGWHVQWLYLLCFAIASVVASWSFVAGIKLIDIGAAGILGLLEVVFGVLFGVLFFNEHLNALELLGVAVIIAAAAIPYVRDYNAQRGRLEG
jgi:drug/metabolite transporter (DMT)-like permease